MSPVDAAESALDIAAAARPPADWDELLTADPAADYAHTPHWTLSAAAHLDHAVPLWLTARSRGRLVGGVAALMRRPPNRMALARLESNLEGTSGGALVAADLPEPRRDVVFRRLLDELLRHRPRWPWSVGVALNPLHEDRFGPLLTADRRWLRFDSPTAMIDLDGGLPRVESERLVANKRNERNRGLRRGATVFATREPDLLAEYYPLYVRACGSWGHVPTPLPFLQALLSDPADRVYLICVQLEGRVIGGHLNVHLGERVFAWNGVSDPDWSRSHFPGTLCFWGDLVEACEREARWFDMGASGDMGSLTGFKKYFGAELKMRGFYVADGSGVALLRRLYRKRRRDGAGARWHDGASGSGRSAERSGGTT